MRGDEPGLAWSTPDGICLLPLAVPADPSPNAPKPPSMTATMLYRFVYDAIDKKKRGYFTKHDFIRSIGKFSPVTMVFGEITPHEVKAGDLDR